MATSDEDQQLAAQLWAQLLTSSCSGTTLKDVTDVLWKELQRSVPEKVLVPARVTRQQFDFEAIPPHSVSVLALHCFILTESVVLSPAASLETFDELEAKTAQLASHPKLRSALSIFLLTRAPLLPKWLSCALAFAVDVLSHRWCLPQATRAVRALYLFLTGVVLSSYSVDARILLAETPGIVHSLLKLATNPEVCLVPCVGALSQVSRNLLNVFVLIGPSSFWRPGALAVESEALVSMLYECAGIQPTEEVVCVPDNSCESLTDLAYAIGSVFLLICSSEDFTARVGREASLLRAVFNLIDRYAQATPVELAKYTLMWMANRHNSGFGLQPLQSENGQVGADPLLGPTASLAGISLSVLHAIGTSKGGAEFLQQNGPRTLRMVRQLCTIHGDERLKTCGLANMAGTLLVTAACATPTDPTDAPLSNPRRLKHYGMLMMCCFCSRVSEGSRRLKVCGECHLARYCGRKCQQADWKLCHSAICSVRPTAAKDHHPHVNC